jgi:hypothetical protein
VPVKEVAHGMEVGLGLLDEGHVASVGENDQLTAADAGAQVAGSAGRAGSIVLARQDQDRLGDGG